MFDGILKFARSPRREGDAMVSRVRNALFAGHEAEPNVEYEDEAVGRAGLGNVALFDRFANALPYLSYDPSSQLFLLEGSKPGQYEGWAYTLELSPQIGATSEMTDYLLNLFTGGVPAYTGLQFMMFGSPRIDRFLDAMVDCTLDPDRVAPKLQEQARVLRRLAQRRAEFYSTGTLGPMVAGSNLRLRHFRAALSVVVPCKDPLSEAAQRETLALRQQQIGTLSSYHLYWRTWDADDLIDFAGTLLNPHRMMKRDQPVISYDAERELRYQIISPDTRIRVEADRVLFSSRRDESDAMAACGMSVRSYPMATTLNSMTQLLGSMSSSAISYPCPFLIVAGVQAPDYESEKQKVMMKAANSVRTAATDIARFLPHLRDVAADWELAQRAYDEGKGTVQMYHQLLLFAEPGKQPDCEEAARAVWRDARFEIATDSLMQSQALLSALPMTYGPLLAKDLKLARRSSTKTAYNAVNMLPIIADWTGTGPRPGHRAPLPVLTPISRRGEPMTIDAFANPSGNQNGIVVGASGSGKSALLNELTMRTLSVGGMVFTFDIGRSYWKLCESLGGQYIEFTDEANLCINPFGLVRGPEEFEEDIEMIKPVIAQMCAHTGKIDDYEMANLELHIRSVYYNAVAAGRSATITELAESLKNNCYLGGPNPLQDDPEWRKKVDEMTHEERARACDPRVRALGVQLFPFTEDGAYGRYFNGPVNIDFNSNYVVLELEELASRPHLQAVVMMLLMYRITQVFYLSARDRDKVCIIDEAWMLLSGDGGSSGGAAAFIEAGYRRARRYRGAFFTATQSVLDYSKSEIARACFENSDVMYLLRQKKESIDQLVETKKLSLDEHQLKLLKSVTTQQGVFSEVYIRIGDLPAAVGRVFLDPFSLLLYSSRAEDFEAVRGHVEKGMTMADAIDRVLEDRRKQHALQAA